MKFLKGNQAIIYIIALMLITAGYLNYTTDNKEEVQQTSASTNSSNTINPVNQVADIGDAALVNSNDVVSESAPAEVASVAKQDSNEENNEQKETQQEANTNDYFENSKIERDKMYSQMIEVYQNVLNSSSSQEKQKQSATEEIQKINNTKNSIMICENLIKTKGFEDNIVFVNGDSINVIVGTTELEKEEVSQIQSIIEREMNTKAEHIHIAIK